MKFMINSLKQLILFVIKGVPEVKIESLTLSEQIEECTNVGSSPVAVT